ncbi:nucleobase:cation symporter-2 family protein [Streptococcus suis]|uniref:Xanthine permease n=3 Tax=Streptococcus suis TaxID=1307 RepID=A0AB33UFA4_STRSU|nr:nucleobase:cation symporter-2 family protein [Streptococcus suis]MBY4959820.1 purine permease [Streptococcus suis]MBY5028878.1 purine permease [Streptococcus suis]MBY6288401.1 purine permease [Streptococcus suis]MBY6296360.1 purine permease [Streptococcus suis]NQN57356.1 purine permease [Streptococcus suis]
MSQKITNEHSSDMLYGIDEQPPKGMAVLLAFQHILAAFAGIIAVPLVVASALGLSVEDTSIMVSASIFVAGIATILQSKGVGPVGSRVSGMMGTDFTFANPAISVGSQLGIAGIVGATIAGSFVEIALSRFVKPLMRFFPPLITGTVVSLIGITLMPVSMDWAAGGAGASDYASDYASVENIGIAFIVLVFTLALNHYGKGMLKTASVFFGMVFGYILCIFLGKVDLSAVGEAAWFALPKIFHYGVKFDLSSILAFIPAYVVSLIGTVGIMMAIGEASNQKISSERAANGVLADGVGSLIAGIFGAGPNTAFSQNVGLITLTKVASRHVMILAGIILTLLGVFPKLSALISIMPQPVLGGVGIIMFGLVAAQGIKTLATVKIGDRELLIISIAFALGIGVTVRPELLSHLPSALQMVFSSGISTGTLAALVLNLVLKEEK